MFAHTRVLSGLCILSLALAQDNEQEKSIPLCNDVLFGFTVSKPKAGFNEDIYEINHQSASDETAVEICQINRERSLHIQLHNPIEISDIFIDDEMYIGNNVHVIATRNISSRHHITISCRRNARTKKQHRVSSDNRMYTTFTCKNDQKGSGLPMNVAIDSVEIRSNGQTTVSLVKDSSSTSILYLRNNEGCLPPGLYSNQLFSPSRDWYPIGHKVNYSCDQGLSIIQNEISRQCYQTGWTGWPPVCQQEKKRVSLAPLGSVAGINETGHRFTFNLTDFFGIKLILINLAERRKLESWEDFFVYPLKISNATHTVQWKIKQANCDSDCDSFELIPETDTYIDCPSCNASYGIRPDEISTLKNISFEYFPQPQHSDDSRLLKECPPIDPYTGMPFHYSERALVISKEINGLIKSQPCREGFQLVKPSQDLLYCENGSWMGEVPKCKIITCKIPPFIENARWEFLYNDLYHVVRYSCNEGFELADDSEFARCDVNTREWIGVPACQNKLESPTGKIDSNCPSVSITTIVIICVLSLIIIILSVVISAMRGGDTATQVIKRLDEPFYVGTLRSATLKPKNEIPVYDERGSKLAVYEEQPIYANAQLLFTNGKSSKVDDDNLYELSNISKDKFKQRTDEGSSVNYASIVVH